MFAYQDLEGVCGYFDAGRQLCGCVGVRAHVVAQVGKVCAARRDVFYQREGFAKGDVRHVGFVAQRVDYERVCAAHGFDAALGQRLAVGDIPDAVCAVRGVYAEAEYGQACVHHGHWQYAYAVDAEFFVWLDDMYVVCGYSRVEMFGKAVWYACAQVVCDIFGAVYGKWAGGAVAQRGYVAVGAQVVDASHVVVVAVRDQERVQRRRPGTQDLLAEVGAAVNQEVCAGQFDYGRGPQPFVPFVPGGTCRAAASYLRNAGGCACAEEQDAVVPGCRVPWRGCCVSFHC